MSVKEQSSFEKQDSPNQPVNSYGNGTSRANWELKFGSFGPLAEGSSLGLSESVAGVSVSSPVSSAVRNVEDVEGNKESYVLVWLGILLFIDTSSGIG